MLCCERSQEIITSSKGSWISWKRIEEARKIKKTLRKLQLTLRKEGKVGKGGTSDHNLADWYERGVLGYLIEWIGNLNK